MTFSRRCLTSPTVIFLSKLVSHLPATLAASELSSFLVAWVDVTPDYPLVELGARDIPQAIHGLRVEKVFHKGEPARRSARQLPRRDVLIYFWFLSSPMMILVSAFWHHPCAYLLIPPPSSGFAHDENTAIESANPRLITYIRTSAPPSCKSSDCQHRECSIEQAGAAQIRGQAGTKDEQSRPNIVRRLHAPLTDYPYRWTADRGRRLPAPWCLRAVYT
jgi:hypothetical protein